MTDPHTETMPPNSSTSHPNTSTTKHVNRSFPTTIQRINNTSSPQTKQAELHKTQRISPDHTGKHSWKGSGSIMADHTSYLCEIFNLPLNVERSRTFDKDSSGLSHDD